MVKDEREREREREGKKKKKELVCRTGFFGCTALGFILYPPPRLAEQFLHGGSMTAKSSEREWRFCRFSFPAKRPVQSIKTVQDQV